MGKKLFTLLFIGLLLVGGLGARGEALPDITAPTDTPACAWNAWSGTSGCAILCHSVNAPNVLVTQINTHLSNTPMPHIHAVEKSHVENLKKQRQLFAARLGDATDTDMARHYIFALRRILR